MKIRFTSLARARFLEGLEFIARDSPAAAVRLREKVTKVLQRLEKFPNSGRSMPEFPDLPHREVVVRSYRFFYRVVGRTVWIVAVWHGAQITDEPRQ